ncbi:MAG TPA: GPR endopeptidase [Firmicutes bacterium]|nr:GPR endopeptidase [Bacillota bacterium]
MYEIRTDLALEAHEINAQAGREDGIRTEEETIDGFLVTTVHVSAGEGERLAKKKAGTYINVDVGKSWLLASEGFAALVALLAGQLRRLFPSGFSGSALVVGLGNYDITADSIGPKAVEKVVVTRHLRTLNPQLYKSAGFGDLCAFAPGVLGQTGMESAEIVHSIVEAVRPALIVAIDALASRRLARLATTVQLCDTGIYPGAGVSNRRSELSKETLGVPVISIGVPTVVDAATLAYDLLGKDADEQAAAALLAGDGKDMFVTLKESDVITKQTARLLGFAINRAFHGDMSVEEMEELLS